MKSAMKRKSGGKTEESPASGDRDYEKDEKDKPARYNQSKVEDEAEERKAGGRAKRKHGGKMEMKAHGEKSHHHAGRKPRKSGGGCENSPMSSAHAGTQAKGRNAVDID